VIVMLQSLGLEGLRLGLNAQSIGLGFGLEVSGLGNMTDLYGFYQRII